MKKIFSLIAILLAFILILSSCNVNNQTGIETTEQTKIPYETVEKTDSPSTTVTPDPSIPNDEIKGIYVIYTSDIHCGVNKGFGFAGLYEMRKNLEKQGYKTILVDNGDAIQGELEGTLSKGEDMIKLMNVMEYDIAIPGNHEFDYTTERFLELTKQANFPYISCNFNKDGTLIFDPYIIKEVAGVKIGFVGVTTPTTITSSTPKFFTDENGNVVYDFMQDKTGEKLYTALQENIDKCREDGADLIYVLAHIGSLETSIPWTYKEIISHVSGIDVFLDGHSHDTKQDIVKDKDGHDVVRSACGTQFSCIGYSKISLSGEVGETNIWIWGAKESANELFGYDNVAQKAIDALEDKMQELSGKVVAKSDVDLVIFNPYKVNDDGTKIRIVRNNETNLGDFCADAIRIQTGADISLENSGGIRTFIEKGDITYGDIIAVHPFGNRLYVIKATGQQILDALEWGAKAAPKEFGGLLQVSGITYEINTSIPTPCITDSEGLLEKIEGQRRVENVLVAGKPIDKDAYYTVAGFNYVLTENGDGNTAFNGAEILQEDIKIDNQVLIDYIIDNLGGTIGEEYSNPYGDGRIKIK